MVSLPSTGPALHQLRFVFEHSAPHLRFVPDVTSGDIAFIWSEIAARHRESPVAIDLTLATSPKATARDAGAPID